MIEKKIPTIWSGARKSSAVTGVRETYFLLKSKSIAVFCCIDDLLIEIAQTYPIKRRGFAPSLSASEVLTMEIVAEFLGMDADKEIWKYFHRHWLGLFPHLKSPVLLAVKQPISGRIKNCYNKDWHLN